MSLIRRTPVALRVALALVMCGMLLSAVSHGISVYRKWDWARSVPAHGFEPGLEFLFTAVVLVGLWLIGGGATLAAWMPTLFGYRSGRIALTAMLCVFVAYNCHGAYDSLDVALSVRTAHDRSFVDVTLLLPYLGWVRVAFDVTLLVLAAVAAVLLWTPGARAYDRRLRA